MYDFVSKDYEFQGGGLSNSTSQKGSNKLRQIWEEQEIHHRCTRRETLVPIGWFVSK